jgi:Dolichyl-phosphate-mannose-protein mannosyltransferase
LTSPNASQIENCRQSLGIHPALVFVLIFVAVFALHAPLLRVPYFWDEAGYYIPAARDLLLTGSLIPRSTPSNAHPPLVMTYLAMWWKLAGYTPLVTRTVMLLVATFSLLGVFRLAQQVANEEVALASVLCTALYPIFFAQSSLAHVDLAAAGLIFWGLHAYVDGRRAATAFWFSCAVLAKETAILAPLALFAWECCGSALRLRLAESCERPPGGSAKDKFLLLAPLIPLVAWYGFHYFRTGYVFGNPEFFRYNVQATLHPLRIVLALLIRLWQTFGYLGLSLLTLGALFAMWRQPLNENGVERPRIILEVQYAFLAVITVYVVAMAILGGALLARYLLPATPLVIIICISTLWRRARLWLAVVTIVALAFIWGWFVNPPYGFSPEDNLAYRDYIRLHQRAESFLEARYPMARVLTAWPATDELTRPYLGYITRPMRVVQIENFTAEQIISATDLRSNFDVAMVFSTKYEPRHSPLERWRPWQQWKTRFFGYYRDIPPAAAAQILGGRLVYIQARNGQWVGIIEMEQTIEANAHAANPATIPSWAWQQ